MSSNPSREDMPALCPKCNRPQPKATVGWLRTAKSMALVCAYCPTDPLNPDFAMSRWRLHNNI